MPRSNWLVQFRSDSCCFGRPGLDDALINVAATDPLDPEPLVLGMRNAGYAGGPTMLAIPSEWCLSVSTVLASSRMTRNRQAVTYAAEEHLPLSAEDMVCDYMAQETDVLSVVADSSTLLPVVKSLEGVGVEVATITPSAVLLLQHLGRLKYLPTDGLVLIADGGQCEVFLTAGGKPRNWLTVPRDLDALRRELGALLLTRSEDSPALRVVAVGFADGIGSAVRELDPEIQVQMRPLDNERALLSQAGEVLAKGNRPWIELRRGQVGDYEPFRLVRGSIRAFFFAVLFVITSMTAIAWMKASEYEEFVQSVEDQKRELFRELFPDARVPTGIRSRLESERRKLEGLSPGSNQVPELRSVTELFVKSLASLPKDLRYRILDIDFEVDRGTLEMEVRQHGDADTIASSLRTNGLAVDPPGTERLGENIGCTVNISAKTQDAEPTR